MQVFGMVLAGGQSRRMSGIDKSLMKVDGIPLVQNAALRLQAQVTSVLLNTNRQDDPFSFLDFPVRADVVPGYLGPLAGLLTGLEWAFEQGGEQAWLVTVPVDVPWFPHDLVARLIDAVVQQQAMAAIASSADRIHPVFGLWSVSLRSRLHHALTVLDQRRVMAWAKSLPAVVVDWPVDQRDPFTNVNTPAEFTVVRDGKLP